MDRITYNELVDRFGANAAHDLLRCIENLAQIKNEIIDMDAHKRFERALTALNDINVAESFDTPTTVNPVTSA